MIVTTAYSIHRPEILPLAEPHMREHDVIMLEEPNSPGFKDMLTGGLTVEQYLQNVDYEFPSFSRRTCVMLRELHASGKAVLQVDPYMDVLAWIHEFFADSGSPDGIRPETLERRVYEVERLWSGALMEYYQKSMGDSFDHVVEAVKFFGRADAARGRLRDDLRAQAVARFAADNLTKYDSVYLEAGYIHVYLLTALKKRLPSGSKVRPLYIMEPLVRRLTGAKQSMGPGDILTVRYVYNPDFGGHEADLQAARSIVRIKVLRKEEFVGSGEDYPHTRDEIEASRLVAALDYRECENMYAELRSLPTAEARSTLEEYVRKKGVEWKLPQEEMEK